VGNTVVFGLNAVNFILSGTSNVAIPVVNGNISLSANGNANILTVTGTGVNVSGTFNTTGNISGNISNTQFVSLLYNSTSQYSYIAIGANSGLNSQGQDSIALGRLAGSNSLAANSIAIGLGAGTSNTSSNSIYIGANAGVNGGNLANVIVVNATGANLNPTTGNGLFVKPVANNGTGGLPSGFYQMAYNPVTGEIRYYLP
jgi:hypothetical protein